MPLINISYIYRSSKNVFRFILYDSWEWKMSRSNRFLIKWHKKAGNQDAPHPLPVVFLWRPQSSSSQRSQNFFDSSSHIIPHPPFLPHRPPSPPHFFPCYQWTLPGQTMKLGRTPLSSPPPSHQLNLLSGKGVDEGVLLLRQVFLTIVSGKLNKSVEEFDDDTVH